MRELLFLLLKVLMAATMGLVVTVTFLRARGLNQKYSEHNHPFWDTPLTSIIALSEEAPLKQQITDLVNHEDNRALYVPVFQDRQARFWVLPTSLYKKYSDSISDYFDLSQIQSEKPELLMPLSDVATISRSLRLVLDLASNVPNVDSNFVDQVKKLHLQNRVLVHSEFDVVLNAVRKLEPQWLYGIPLGERTRAAMLTSLMLEPTATINGDVLVYFSPDYPGALEIIQPRLIKELHRRHKRVYLGPPGKTKKPLPKTIDGTIRYWSIVDAT